MEISNNRIKVTSMKTFAKFFLHFSLVILSCLTAGCPIPNSEILKYSNLIQNKGWK